MIRCQVCGHRGNRVTVRPFSDRSRDGRCVNAVKCAEREAEEMRAIESRIAHREFEENMMQRYDPRGWLNQQMQD